MTEAKKTSVIKQIAKNDCWHCSKPRGEHSRKNLMRCLYATEYNLYHAVIKIQNMQKELDELKPSEPKELDGK